MRKTDWNYWVDVLIAGAFLVSAVSGLVFLVPISGASVLGVSYRVWDGVHIWSSLAMMAGVGAHLFLHARWITSMTKRMFGARRGVDSKAQGVAAWLR